MFLEISLICLGVIYLIYHLINSRFNQWKKRGIPLAEGHFILRDMISLLFQRQCFLDVTRKLYENNDVKYFGAFEFFTPVLFIRDPELIKKITVKDFDHFVNHRNTLSTTDPHDLFSNSIFLMNDAKWRDMRTTLSPAFTGSKMRIMFHLITELADNALDYLKSLHKTDSGVEINFQDFSTRFTNDVIASAAFGLRIDSFTNQENEFYLMGKEATTFSTTQFIKFILITILGPLAPILKIKIFPYEIDEYYLNLILQTMKYRKEHNITRPDMINVIMEANGMNKGDQRKDHSRQWTDIELVAQSFGFFFEGFYNIASVIVFAAHEMVENPKVQDRLYAEVKSIVDELNGKPIFYDALQKMKYLEMVIFETLRKWNPNILSDRMCTKDIEYDFEDGSSLKFLKGDHITIPTAGFHYDPNYFPNPEKFDPERFNEENKRNINPFVYMPFGTGPRSCLGIRFAMMEIKIMLFYLIRDFKIEKCSKTCSPLRSSRTSQMMPDNGSFLKFAPRNKESDCKS